MLKNVAVVALDRVAPFELGVLCEVFGADRSDAGLPKYDFALCAADPTPIRTTAGFTIDTPYGVDRLAEADLVAVPAVGTDRAEYPPQLLAALRAAVDRGARVLSVCTGAFVLAEAGLLDGRRATTHWRSLDRLRALGSVEVLEQRYVDEGVVVTSAGISAGIDMALHALERLHGREVAGQTARFLEYDYWEGSRAAPPGARPS